MFSLVLFYLSATGTLAGDWDLGAHRAALRIQQESPEAFEAFFCKRSVLIDSGRCTDTHGVQFRFSPDLDGYVRTEPDGRWIMIQPNSNGTIRYQFKGPWGSDEFDGVRIR